MASNDTFFSYKITAMLDSNLLLIGEQAPPVACTCSSTIKIEAGPRIEARPGQKYHEENRGPGVYLDKYGIFIEMIHLCAV